MFVHSECLVVKGKNTQCAFFAGEVSSRRKRRTRVAVDSRAGLSDREKWHDACQFGRVVAASLAEPFEHGPRGFLRDADLRVKLDAADALAP